jgi:predicted RNase H-like HicB family nuclease
MTLYDLKIKIEDLKDGSDYRYLATSPDLPNLLVVGETAEEVLSQAPHVAAALIVSMQAAGDQLPDSVRRIPELPFVSHLTVPV